MDITKTTAVAAATLPKAPLIQTTVVAKPATAFSSFIRRTTKQHLRAIVIGPPKSGKTTLALSFPNPLVINFDNNTRPGVEELPLWDPAFIDTLAKRVPNPAFPGVTYPNVRDATLKIMRMLDQLEPGRTLIFDSMSVLDESLTAQEECEPKPMGKTEKGDIVVNTQALFWKRKAFYATILCALPRYNGNVIALVHQAQEKNDDGVLIGQIYPAITGQMKTKMAGFFNNCWQTVIKDLPGGQKAYEIRGSGSAMLGLGGSVKFPKEFMPAHYDYIKEYL